MRRFTLPDGTVIDFEQTSKVNGPSQRYGLNYGTSYGWYRVNGGDWHVTNHRTLNRFAEWCAMCETVADFYEGERG